MPNVNEMFPGAYLKADDLGDKDWNLVIEDVVKEELNNEQKWVLRFHGADRGLVLNKTNAGRIAAMYGQDTEQWRGNEITLASEWVEFRGKTVAGIRVQMNSGKAGGRTSPPPTAPPQDDAPPPAPAAADDSDIPF